MNLYDRYTALTNEGKHWEAANVYLDFCKKQGFSAETFIKVWSDKQMADEDEKKMIIAKAKKVLK